MLLYQSPKYRTDENSWFDSFFKAASATPENVTFDLTSAFSALSLNHLCDNNTLLKEIKKNPWYSSIREDGSYKLEAIPEHKRLFYRVDEIAERLTELLIDELSEVCQNYREIYLLLSGGLDSRVVASVLAEAKKRGKIDAEINAVTWGIKESRDVYLASCIADELNFNWENIEIGPETILKNLDLSINDLGCLATANHIHGMSWFENVPSSALVIAASYGDGIGRAEYSSKHVLELNYINPINRFKLIGPDYYPALKRSLNDHLRPLHVRSHRSLKYELCELEKQAQYMRNMIAQAMSIIEKYCDLYQAFISPEVFSFMWSVHPSLRNNNIYNRVLLRLNRNIAYLPWARTNKSLSGKTTRIDPSLSKGFGRYQEWISTDLFDTLYDKIDFEFLDSLKVLSMENVNRVCENVRSKMDNYHIYNIFFWFINFSALNSRLEKMGKTVNLEEIIPERNIPLHKQKTRHSFLHTKLRNNSHFMTGFKKLLSTLRVNFLKLKFLLIHPPVFKK